LGTSSATHPRACGTRSTSSRCFRPHGPSGQTGVSALDGENWAVFTQSKDPQEAFEFLRIFYKREHYMKYCHSVPIHLTPIFKSMIDDPEYLAHPRIRK